LYYCFSSKNLQVFLCIFTVAALGSNFGFQEQAIVFSFGHIKVQWTQVTTQQSGMVKAEFPVFDKIYYSFQTQVFSLIWH